MATEANDISVINRATSQTKTVPFKDLTVDTNSIVKIPASHSSVASSERAGNDLILRFQDGRELRLTDYFNSAENQVVFEDGNALWQGEYSSALDSMQFTELGSMDSLLVGTSATASAATAGLSATTLGLGAAGLGGIALASGGGGGDSAEEATAPLSQLTINSSGTSISGRGEPNATIAVRTTSGELLGTAIVGANGTFTVALSPAQVDGSVLAVTQLDGETVTSRGSVNSPDMTAPDAVEALSVDESGTVLTGEGEAGAIVTVRNSDGDVIGSGTVASDGQFSVTLSPAQLDGSTLQVTQSDTSGNESATVTALSPDRQPPAQADNLQLNDDRTTLDGSGEPGATVTVRNAENEVIGTAVVQPNGSFAVALSTPLEPQAQIFVTLADKAGNVSNQTTFSVPGNNVLDAPTNLTVAEDGQLLTGTAEPGLTVLVVNENGKQVGTGTVAADGTFSISLSPAQIDGGALQVALNDDQGNTSPSETVLSPDAIAPEPASELQVGEDGATVTGRGEAGATVSITNAQDEIVGTGIVATTGTFSVALSPAQVNGAPLSVDLTDAAGNTSSDVQVTSPDLVSPSAPASLAISSDGSVISGTGERGAEVVVRDAANTIIGTGTVKPNGSFAVVVSPPQVDGSTISVALTDQAGNTSSATSVETPDQISLASPSSITLSSDGWQGWGIAHPNAEVRAYDADNQMVGWSTVNADGTFLINFISAQSLGLPLRFVTQMGDKSSSPAVVDTPDLVAPVLPTHLQVNSEGTELTGKAESGATVEVRDESNLLVGTGTVNSSGTFSVALSPAQTDGQRLSVILQDAAGNTSSTVSVPAPDTTSPNAPTDVDVYDNGETVSGMGEAGAIVTIRDSGDNIVGTGVVQPDGTFDVRLTSVNNDGSSLFVTFTDAEGNVSAEVSVNSPDLTAPDAAQALQLNSTGTLLSGAGEVDATVVVKNSAGLIVGRGSVLGDGSFAVTLEPPQVDGNDLSVLVVDEAGNASTPSAIQTPNLTDIAAPTNLAVNSDGTILTGEGEAGTRVTVWNAFGEDVGTAIVSDDNTFSVSLVPAQTDGGPLQAILSDGDARSSDPATVFSPDLQPPEAASSLQVNEDGTVISGVGEPDATVRVRNIADEIIGSGIVQDDGTFSVTLSPPQIDGTALFVSLTDTDGNTSSESETQSVDLVAPDIADDLLINNLGTVLSGTAEAGASVTVLNAQNQVIGRAIVQADNSFSVSLDSPQVSGEILRVIVSDVAGNISAAATVSTPDITAPSLPQNIAINNEGTEITGSGEPGALAIARDAVGQVIGTATVLDNGSFTVALSPAQVTGEMLSVSLQDTAGNISEHTNINSPDSTAPLIPTALEINADGTIVSGEGEVGALVNIQNSEGELLASGTVQANGTFSLLLSSPQIAGETLAVILIDAFDNSSPAGSVTAPDLVAPDNPIDLQLSEDGSVLTGKGEIGAAVMVKNAANLTVGVATVGPDGAFSVIFASPQINGEPLEVTLTDLAGNASSAVEVSTPDLTTIAPAFNIAVSDDGEQLDGEGETGRIVTVVDASGNAIGTGVVQDDGSFTIPLAFPQVAGETLQVILSDSVGHYSSPAYATSPDLTAPEAASNLAVSDDGTMLSGTGESGARITVRNARGEVIGNAVVPENGNFEVSLSPAHTEGSALSVTQTDSAGNTSEPALVSGFDTAPPASPDNLVVSNDGSQLSGTGEATATITVRSASNQIVGTGVVGTDGNFIIDLSPAQTDGLTLTVTQTDTSGNISSAANVVTPDISAPDAPENLMIADDGSQVSGTGEAGAVVRVLDRQNNIVGSSTIDSNGNFAITLNPAQQDGGLLHVVLTDLDNNDSEAVWLLTPDLTAPDAPFDLAVNDSGTELTGEGEAGTVVQVYDEAGNSVGTGVVNTFGRFTVELSPTQGDGRQLTTVLIDASQNTSSEASVNAPDLVAPDVATNLMVSADGTTVSGEGEPAAIVTIVNEAGQLIGLGSVQENGKFSVVLSNVQINAETLQVILTDAAENASIAGTVDAPDLTAPDMPLNLTVSANGQTLAGTGEAGARVVVENAADEVVGTGVVSEEGEFSLTLIPAQGDSGTLRVRLIDDAGNVSDDGTVMAADLVAPAAPAGLQMSADGMILTGSGEPGAEARVYNAANVLIGTGIVEADRSFSIILSSAQTDGSAVSVTLTDAAENTSSAGLVASPDLEAPAQPDDILVSSDGTSVQGTGEPGALVEIRNDANTLVGTSTVASDGNFNVTLAPAQTNGELLSVVLSDSAGNSAPEISVYAPDLEAPEPPENLVIDSDGVLLTGTGEANARVEVKNASGEIVGTGIVNSAGNFEVALYPAQIDDGTLSVTLSDDQGNTSAIASVIAPDLIAPAAANNIAVKASGDALSGEGEPAARVEVRDAANQLIGSGTIANDGTFDVELSPAQTNGETLNVVLIDAAGNVSSETQTVAPDITAPDAPANLQITPDGLMVIGTGEAGARVEVRNAANELLGTGRVGVSGNFNISLPVAQEASQQLDVTLIDEANNTSLPGVITAPDLVPPAQSQDLQVNADGTILTGTGEAGASVIVRNASNVIVATGVIDGQQTFSVPLTPPQIDGGELRVFLADASGNISSPATINVPDLVEIAPPTALLVDSEGDTLTGNGEAGLNVTVWNENGSQIGSAVVDPDGTFTVEFTSPQLKGEPISVVLDNGAGKYSSAATVGTPDLTPPDAPANLLVIEDGGILVGRGEVGATVIVRNSDNDIVGSGVVAANGSFRVNLNPIQNEGSPLSVALTDPAGNVSASVNVSTPDLTAPDSPQELAINAEGTSLSGTGEGGAKVEVKDAAGNLLGTSTALAAGGFSVTLAPPQVTGEPLSVTFIDAAGNRSDASVINSPDLTAPEIPQNVVMTPTGDSLSGIGEPGAVVEVRNSANIVVGTAVVLSDGTFEVGFDAAQQDGGLLEVTLSDEAGNVSVGHTIATPDLLPPDTPQNITISATGNQLTGEGEVGSQVNVFNGENQLVGEGVVGEDGTFTITLHPAQDEGQNLSVALSDASGNVSSSASIEAPTVVDIAAFDNHSAAKVNIIPSQSSSSTGSAAYTLLLGLLGGINLQVLATPSINFSVAPGTTGEATLLLSSPLEISALGDHRVVIQGKQNGQWQSLSGSDDATLLTVNLLGENTKGVVVDGLAAGEYRAFVTINALVGLSVSTTLSGVLTQTDYGFPSDYDDIAVFGNVLLDNNDQNQQDVITPNTVVRQVNATAVSQTGTTTIEGQYGTLSIEANGDYTYTPHAVREAIGKAEQFTYQIVDTVTGRQSTATLYVRIDSDQVDLSWGSPGENATAVLSAGDDSDIATLVYQNLVDAPVSRLLGTFNTTGGLLGKGAATFTFKVGENDVSNATIFAGSATTASLSLLPSYSLSVEKANGSGGWVAVPDGSISGIALLGLSIDGAGLALSLNGLTAGDYRLTVNTSNTLGTAFVSSVRLTQTITHLDEYTMGSNPGTTGNLLLDDNLDSSYTELWVMQNAGGYKPIGHNDTTVTGQYGVLTINKAGDYNYVPNGNLVHSSDVTEVFTYQLRSPTGETVTAELSILIDVAGAGTIDTTALTSDTVDVAAVSDSDDETSALGMQSAWLPDFDAIDDNVVAAEETGSVESVNLSVTDVLNDDAHLLFSNSEVAQAPSEPVSYMMTNDDSFVLRSLIDIEQQSHVVMV